MSKDKKNENEEKEKNFWTTLPGILTGSAAVITAIGGIYATSVHNQTEDSSPSPSSPNNYIDQPDIRKKSPLKKSDTSSISPGRPLVILLDNSGSMGICSVTREKDGKDNCVPDAENPYRIDVVKEAIRRRIDPSISGVDLDSTQIGLVEFGNWQAYGFLGTSQPISSDADSRFKCEAVNILVRPELDNREKLVEVLTNDTIKANDSGVTPIGFAINTVVYDVLEAQKLLPARILLISDGQPNCSEEYKFKLCDIVAGLERRGVDLSVDIVGYKANEIDKQTGNTKDREFENCANKYATLRYWGSRDNPSELNNLVDRVLSYPD